MTTLWTIILGSITGLLLGMISKSFYTPKARTIQAVMLFGKLYDIITNIEGKIVDKEDGPDKWKLIDGENGSNIHFFLWPFCKIHTFPLTYVKEKMIGQINEGEHIVWEDKKTGRCLVSRTGISDHLEWRVDYPTVTSELETEELASVDIYTNNMLEVINPAKVFFGVKDWMSAASDILHGGHKGLVSSKKLHDLNQFSSKDKDGFNTEMLNHSNNEANQPELPTFGFLLIKSVFKDFRAANEMTTKLMEADIKVSIAEKEGDAEISKETRAAKAYGIKQAAIVKWKKKYLVDTGLAKVDAKGNITELVPDANTKLSAEAIKKLSELKGTLVLDSGDLNKMFNINPTKKEE
ncbi:MAG: hypothetical protein WCX46_01765 [Candidatus Paceibacterota bacterium]